MDFYFEQTTLFFTAMFSYYYLQCNVNKLNIQTRVRELKLTKKITKGTYN